MVQDQDDSRDTSVRDRTRRLFMRSVGVAGLGVTVGTTVSATDKDDSDGGGRTEASPGDGERTEIDSCTVIDEPGEYELVDDLTPDELNERACIVIDADDITLYGNGHTIDLTETSTDRWTDPACIANNPNRLSQEWNLHVENVEVRGGHPGIEMSRVRRDGATFAGVTAVDNSAGFYFRTSTGTLADCVAKSNDIGISLEGDTHISAESAEATLENVTVRDNGAVGLDVGEWGEADVVRSRIVQNGLGVVVSADAGEIVGSARIEESHICGNETYGVNAGATPGPGEDAGPGEEPGPWVAEVDATGCYWGASNGPSSRSDPDASFADPVTGRLANGTGDAISESLEPGVSNVRFDPFHESTIDGVGADR